LIYMWLFQSSS